ncbi:unnamed protein product [Rhizopus stolonifer]
MVYISAKRNTQYLVKEIEITFEDNEEEKKRKNDASDVEEDNASIVDMTDSENRLIDMNPYNKVSETIFSPNIYPTLNNTLNVFNSLVSTQDKQDLIYEIQKVLNANVAKNPNNVLPPGINDYNKGCPKGTKRRNILQERIDKNEVKRAKMEAQADKRKKAEEER